MVASGDGAFIAGSENRIVGDPHAENPLVSLPRYGAEFV
jgi:hypothetical protein